MTILIVGILIAVLIGVVYSNSKSPAPVAKTKKATPVKKAEEAKKTTPKKEPALAAKPTPPPVAEQPKEEPAPADTPITAEEPTVTEDSQDAITQDSTTEEATDETTEGGEEEVAAEEATETEEGMAEEAALTFGGKGADEAAQADALDKLVKEAIESADYLALRSTLEKSLKSSYPKIFEVKTASVKKKKKKEASEEEEGAEEEDEASQEETPACVLAHLDVKKLKVKSKIGQRAIALCYCLDLMLENGSNSDLDGQKDFMTFLLAVKKKNCPADTFLSGIIRHRVEKEFAGEMLTELSNFYRDEPEKAYREINSITSSRADKINKRYYPVAKKEVEKEIERILKTKPSGGADEPQQEAVNLANVYRFICGVKPTLKYDREFGADAEDAAAACEKAGQISHDLGHSTDACNLHKGMDTRAKSVPGYIHDPGGPNRAARGHRNWILDPAAAKTAFGQSGVYHAMRVMDTSSGWSPAGGYSYPGRGYFPIRYMHGDGWSYYAPPGKSMGKEPKVEMWRLSRAPRNLVSQSDLSKTRQIPIKEIFPNGRYIVFEPDYEAPAMRKNDAGQLDGVYWIRVHGDGFKDEYLVEFY